MPAMDTVLVTGALGQVGSWTVRRLASDYHVVGIDRTVPDGVVESAQFRAAELTAYGPIRELIDAVNPDTVVHLAAIPRSGLRAGTETFSNNVLAAYNVLHAAGATGADIVWTSSEAVYGDGAAKLAGGLPVDESNPVRPHNPYALSKAVSEQIGAYVSRQFDVDVVTIRSTWVNSPGHYGTAATREQFDPETTTPEHIAAANLWSYIDIRDLVDLIETAIAEESLGTEQFVAAAPETYLDRPTREAIAAVFGRPVDIDGHRSIYSTAKAAQLLDWEPTRSWREAEHASSQAPAFFDPTV